MSNLMPKAGESERYETGQGVGDPEELAMGRGISGEGYVRVRVRNSRGKLSIISVKRVEGPLVQPQGLEAGFVSEVRHGSRRISAETIPDLGVRRSFPPPEGEETKEVRGHHITELTTYDFTVRIPAHEFTQRSLGDLQISLYETVARPQARQIDARPLDAQFTELRQVGQLEGIRMDELPENVQKQMDEVLRRD